MLKKLILFILMIAYLYTLEFDIFLTEKIRIPAPLIFGIPLIAFFSPSFSGKFFSKELFFYFYACLLYFTVGQGDLKGFFVSVIIFIVCTYYFRFFIGNDIGRFKISIFIFFSFLVVSCIVMLLNHTYPDTIDSLRSRLIDDLITQSPSGITSKIFTFGYQVAALSVFLVIYSIITKKNLLIQAVILAFCLVSIYYGMQRSALVDFCLCVGLFILLHFKPSKLLLLGAVIAAGFLVISSSNLLNSSGAEDNIFSKNKHNLDDGEQRSDLVTENLKIYSNYPYGLVFYNKTWADVVKDNPAYPDGITSHNGYLMFITYLGPFIGIAFLIGLYYKVGKVFIYALKQVKLNQHPLLISLSFAFVAVSINSFFHNPWLLEPANGVIIFLYVSSIHYYDVFTERKLKIDTIKTASVKLNKKLIMQ